MRQLFCILLVALAVCASSTAMGQQPATTPASAEDHSRRGIAAFKAGNYKLAARHFLDAHALASDPVLLYNAAYALGRAGELEQACDVARRAAQAGLAGTKTRTRNDARLTAWAVAIAAAKRTHAPSSGPLQAQATSHSLERSDAPETASGSDTLTWLGAGGVAVGAGLLGAAWVVDWRVDSKSGELVEARQQRDREAYDKTLADIETQQGIGRLLVYSGAALTLGGVAALVTPYFTGTPDDPRALVPSVATNGDAFGFSLSGSF